MYAANRFPRSVVKILRMWSTQRHHSSPALGSTNETCSFSFNDCIKPNVVISRSQSTTVCKSSLGHNAIISGHRPTGSQVYRNNCHTVFVLPIPCCLWILVFFSLILALFSLLELPSWKANLCCNSLSLSVFKLYVKTVLSCLMLTFQRHRDFKIFVLYKICL